MTMTFIFWKQFHREQNAAIRRHPKKHTTCAMIRVCNI